MYNETLKAENKIITKDDLFKIFQMMGETLKKYQKISQMEEQKNRMLDYAYQSYSFKDNGSRMKVTVDFYDNTTVTFDNYDNFMSIFYSRLDEIKNLNVNYYFYYDIVTPEPNRSRNHYSQSITMYITENKLEISLNLDSHDSKLEDIYNTIKNVILNAPPKYDDIIKNKNKIISVVSFSIGMIPSIIITSLLLLVGPIRSIFLSGYVIYPIVCIIMSYVLGGVITSSKLDKYYDSILRDKVYAGYSNGKSIYKDDIDKFISTSEILIGTKHNNLENRNAIKQEYEKYKKLLPKELIVLLVISFIILIIGLF